MYKNLMLMTISLFLVAGSTLAQMPFNEKQAWQIKLFLLSESVALSPKDTSKLFIYPEFEVKNFSAGIFCEYDIFFRVEPLDYRIIKFPKHDYPDVSEYKFFAGDDSIFYQPFDEFRSPYIKFYRLFSNLCGSGEYIIGEIDGSFYRLYGFIENDYEWFYKKLNIGLFRLDNTLDKYKKLASYMYKRNHKHPLAAYKWIKVDGLDLENLHRAFKHKHKENKDFPSLHSIHYADCTVSVPPLKTIQQARFSATYHIVFESNIPSPFDFLN